MQKDALQEDEEETREEERMETEDEEEDEEEHCNSYLTLSVYADGCEDSRRAVMIIIWFPKVLQAQYSSSPILTYIHLHYL